MSDIITPTIATLNDQFRRGDPRIPGQVILTIGLNALLEEQEVPFGHLAQVVKEFDQFTEDNDPHKEHDFGAFMFLNRKCFWKIDVYDKTLNWAADDPTDLNASHRILTVMLAEEY